MSSNCTLCGLPTPDPPITDEEVEGIFCCTGCLEVFKMLQDMDPEKARKVQEKIREEEDYSAALSEIPENACEAYLQVDGMHCSTCETFIETMADEQEGVYKSEASYASDMVKIYFDPEKVKTDDLPRFISHYGYKAHLPDDKQKKSDENDTVARLIIGGFFSLMGLMFYILFLYPIYLGGSGLLNLSAAEGTYVLSNICVMTTFVLGYTGYPILRGAWVSVKVLKPNMDLLVALAALSAYFYSVGAMLSGLTEVYFDVSMTIIMVVSLGNFYEYKIKSKRTDLLSRLTEQQINEARVLRNGTPENMPLAELQPGDRVMVRAGERIPVDGTIIEGQATINEALITGESLPISRKIGDNVIGGTVVTDNALVIETGEEVKSTLDHLVKLMWDIQASRPGAQRLADRIARVFVPLVLILAVAATSLRLLFGDSLISSLLAGLAVLIVSCPCALGLATPLAIASGVREALQRHIVIKDVSVFEQAPEIELIAFDKTGTLTTGTMQLLDKGINPEALTYARALEQYSSHPVARAIVVDSGSKDLTVRDVQTESRGISGIIDDKQIFVGHPDWVKTKGYNLSEDQKKKILLARKSARIPVVIGWNDKIQDVFEVGDELRPEWKSVIAQLKNKKREIAVITGDSELAADQFRKYSELDHVFAQVRPASKSEIIRQLRKKGQVAMVGDGSNDAPALAEADLGIAFGPTALAADSADIVILEGDLNGILSAFNAARLTNRRIRQNLGWAFLYNATAIPLAIAGLINPLFAALAMAGSSLLVVINSSRGMKLLDDLSSEK